MITFDAIAADGTRERLRFETQAETDAQPINGARPATASIGSPWSKSLQRFVTIAEE